MRTAEKRGLQIKQHSLYQHTTETIYVMQIPTVTNLTVILKSLELLYGYQWKIKTASLLSPPLHPALKDRRCGAVKT